MNFSQALELLKEGKRIRRADWDSKIKLDCARGDVFILDGSQTIEYCYECDSFLNSKDIMADDWQEVKDDKG